jgi:hypothetical protein
LGSVLSHSVPLLYKYIVLEYLVFLVNPLLFKLSVDSSVSNQPSCRLKHHKSHKCHTTYQLQLLQICPRDVPKTLEDEEYNIVDWLSPPNEPLIPPIARNVKVDRGFNHQATGALLCPAGVDWSDKA